ncbi:MAG: LuxR C-terminal-related transcriptional regulator [Myxococcota bacterium]
MPAFNEEMRQRVTRVLDTFTCGVVAEVDRRIIFANEKFAKMVGVARESLWGVETHDLVPPELRDQLVEEGNLSRQGDRRTRLTALLMHDGTTQPVLVMPMARFETIDTGITVGFALIIELSSVMTAKHMLYDGREELRSSLSQIAVQLHTASLLAGNSPAADPDIQHPELAELSRREREVLARLVEGKRVPVIAQQLFISAHTVRNHLKSMFRKLGVGSQAELIEYVREIG